MLSRGTSSKILKTLVIEDEKSQKVKVIQIDASIVD